MRVASNDWDEKARFCGYVKFSKNTHTFTKHTQTHTCTYNTHNMHTHTHIHARTEDTFIKQHEPTRVIKN